MDRKFSFLESRYEVTSVIRSPCCAAASAFENSTGNPVIVKYVPLRDRRLSYRNTTIDGGEARLIIIREILTLRQLSHCNVVTLKRVLAMDYPPPLSEIYLVLEHGSRTLSSIANERLLTNDDVRHYAYQLFCGLHYLHSARIIHGCLYSGNLVVNDRNELKVSDFGLAQFNQHYNSDGAQELYPSFNYSAPELLLAPKRYSYALDLFSSGCVLAEMLGSRQLFNADRYDTYLAGMIALLGTPQDNELSWCTNSEAIAFLGKLPQSRRTLWSSLFASRDECALELLDECLRFDPTKRVNAHNALAHRVFDCVRDKSKEEPMPVETYVSIQVEANMKCTNTMDQVEELVDDYV